MKKKSRSAQIVAATQESDNREPRVGIFWLLGDGRPIIDSAPLSKAERYGDALTHPRSHIDTWQELQSRGLVDAVTEYEELPRGRVAFDAKARKFILYADRCILAKSKIVQEIISEMNLPPDSTEVATDSHYRCARCLLKYPAF